MNFLQRIKLKAGLFLSRKTASQYLPEPMTSESDGLKSIATFYNDLSIPLQLFCKISDSKDVGLLQIEGTATDEQLQEAWANIQEAYSRKTQGGAFDLYLHISKKAALFNVKVEFVNNIVDLLSQYPSPEVANLLSEWADGFTFDLRGDWLAQIKRIHTKLERDKLKLDADLKQHAKKDDTSTKTMYENVSEILIYIGKNNKTFYKIADLSLLDFCILYEDSLKQANKMLKNGR